MIAIIISHNQSEYIEPISKALGNTKHLFVFDRCTDKSEAVAKKIGVDFVCNTEGDGRQCSRARNLGASLFPEDDILFLDGDRVPLFDVSRLEVSQFDVTLVKSENDIRDELGSLGWKAEPRWGSFNNGLFASCVLIRRNALDKVLQQFGYIFDTDFTKWGEEDRHLGDLLFHVGATCGFASDDMRVLGRATLKEERQDDFREMTFLRIKKLFNLGIDYLVRDFLLDLPEEQKERRLVCIIDGENVYE